MRRRGPVPSSGLVLLLLLSAPVLAAAAEPLGSERLPEVAVLRPMSGAVVLSEIATRVWAELTAGGIRAVLIDCPAEPEPCRPPAPPAGEPGIALTTSHRDGETTMEVALTAPGRDHPTVRRSLTASDESASDAKVMAIRAVELVRSMLLEELDAGTFASGAASTASAVDLESPGERQLAEPAQSLWSLGMGEASLAGFGHLGPAYGFALRATHLERSAFGLSMTAAAVFSNGTGTIDGPLTRNEELAVIEGLRRFGAERRLRAHLALGGGGYRLGGAWPPAPSSTGAAPAGVALWALLLSAGGGAELSLADDLGVFAEGRLVLATPYPVFYAPDGKSRLSTADPSVLLSFGLQASF